MLFNDFINKNKNTTITQEIFKENNIKTAFDNNNLTLYMFFDDGLRYCPMDFINIDDNESLTPILEKSILLKVDETISSLIFLLNDLIDGSNGIKMPWLQLIKNEEGQITRINSEIPVRIIDSTGTHYLN